MYGVRFVGEHELPKGRDWLMVRRRDTGRTHLLVKESAVSEEVLEEAWAGYRLLLTNLAEEALAVLPQQRQESPSPRAAWSDRRAYSGG